MRVLLQPLKLGAPEKQAFSHRRSLCHQYLGSAGDLAGSGRPWMAAAAKATRRLVVAGTGVNMAEIID